MQIRSASRADLGLLWPTYHAIAAAGETYALAPDSTPEEAAQFWFDTPLHSYLAESDGEFLGICCLRANRGGGGSHVANASFMVAESARGRGVATALCQHVQQAARELGFLAMQFNFVVATNEPAVRLWTKLGFETVGRLPRAFRHPTLGLVDALVMYKWLAE